MGCSYEETSSAALANEKPTVKLADSTPAPKPGYGYRGGPMPISWNAYPLAGQAFYNLTHIAAQAFYNLTPGLYLSLSGTTDLNKFGGPERIPWGRFTCVIGSA